MKQFSPLMQAFHNCIAFTTHAAEIQCLEPDNRKKLDDLKDKYEEAYKIVLSESKRLYKNDSSQENIH